MGQVNIEKVEIIERPKQGKPLSVRVTITWPMEDADEESTLRITTKDSNGSEINSVVADAIEEIVISKTDVITESGMFSIEVTAGNTYETKQFRIAPAGEMDPPSAGFIPIT
jgi:hypothetical protein